MCFFLRASIASNSLVFMYKQTNLNSVGVSISIGTRMITKIQFQYGCGLKILFWQVTSYGTLRQ